MAEGVQRYNAQAAAPVAARTQAEVCRFFAGLELIEPGIDSAAALSMITKEKSPMRVLFFRDHEISGLRPAAAARSLSRSAGAAKDLSAANPAVRRFRQLEK
ncbi:MAG: SAM-dependent methyltransferase [Trebonia sp.]